MQFLSDLDILARPSRPTSLAVSPLRLSGSGNTSAYSSLKRLAVNRDTSTTGSWSSPTGTRSALQKRMSAAWLTGYPRKP